MQIKLKSLSSLLQKLRLAPYSYDKVENRGKAEGANSVALLMKNLFDQNRIEDAKRASEDKEYRTRLMKELGIS